MTVEHLWFGRTTSVANADPAMVHASLATVPGTPSSSRDVSLLSAHAAFQVEDLTLTLNPNPSPKPKPKP